MLDFIDEQRSIYGIELICAMLPIAPSTDYAHKAREAQPGRFPAREQRDEMLSIEIRRVWQENFRVYGVRKVWRHLLREGVDGGTLHGCTADAGARAAGAWSTVARPERLCPHRRASAQRIGSSETPMPRGRTPCGWPI